MDAMEKEYLRLRERGFTARAAIACARGNVLFATLEASRLVRARVEPDEDFQLDWCFDNEKQKAAVVRQINRDGVWGYVVEARNPLGGGWQVVSSVWGLVGCESDWLDDVSDIRSEGVGFVNSFSDGE